MTTPWAEQFALNDTDSIVDDTHGRIEAMWVTEVEAGDSLGIRRLAVSSSRHQGLVIECSNDLVLGSCSTHRIVLWSHTSPEELSIEVPDGGRVRMWNVWRDEPSGIVQAWLGWAGIAVSDDGPNVVLKCSDGVESGDPTDLVIEITRRQ